MCDLQVDSSRPSWFTVRLDAPYWALYRSGRYTGTSFSSRYFADIVADQLNGRGEEFLSQMEIEVRRQGCGVVILHAGGIDVTLSRTVEDAEVVSGMLWGAIRC